MDRIQALGRLPKTYRDALRLRDQGLGDADLCAALGVEPEALATTIRLAEAKLNRLLQQEDPDGQSQGPQP